MIIGIGKLRERGGAALGAYIGVSDTGHVTWAIYNSELRSNVGRWGVRSMIQGSDKKKRRTRTSVEKFIGLLIFTFRCCWFDLALFVCANRSVVHSKGFEQGCS